MSHKQAKAARKAVRAAGHHPRSVDLVVTNGYFIPFGIGTGRGAQFLGNRILKDFCGRALVKQMKKSMRAGAPA